MSVYKKTKADLEINNIKISAEIVIEVDEDYLIEIGRDFDFGDAKENAAYLKRFNPGGDLFNGLITVTASAFGLEGFDSLGGCHLHCNNMFNSKPFETDVEQTIADHAMVENALSALENAIRSQAKLLKDFA